MFTINVQYFEQKKTRKYKIQNKNQISRSENVNKLYSKSIEMRYSPCSVLRHDFCDAWTLLHGRKLCIFIFEQQPTNKTQRNANEEHLNLWRMSARWCCASRRFRCCFFHAILFLHSFPHSSHFFTMFCLKLLDLFLVNWRQTHLFFRSVNFQRWLFRAVFFSLLLTVRW